MKICICFVLSSPPEIFFSLEFLWKICYLFCFFHFPLSLSLSDPVTISSFSAIIIWFFCLFVLCSPFFGFVRLVLFRTFFFLFSSSFLSLLLPHFFLTQRCVQILKSQRQISMTVRSPPTLNSTAPLHGFGPPSRDPMYASMAPLLTQQTALPPGAALGTTGSLPYRQTCSWMDRHGRPASPPMEYGGRRSDRRDR